MPVKEGERFLPSSNRMIDAFQAVERQRPRIGKTIGEVLNAPPEIISKDGSDYFSAGVAYFANRGHDAYMQEIGTVMWRILNQQDAHIAFTDNMVGTAIDLGAPTDFAQRRLAGRSEPYVLILEQSTQNQIDETAYALVPFDFLVKAKTKPVEALAMIAGIGSCLRDFANGRLEIDPENTEIRQSATQVHFLHEAIRQNPGIELKVQFKQKMALYPKGINSLESSQRY